MALRDFLWFPWSGRRRRGAYGFGWRRHDKMSFQKNFKHPFLLAHHDFFKGIRSWSLWFGLGIHDIRIRYKRTLLGPLWITASQAATFICMGMLFSAVLKNDVTDYLPYLAAGMVIWSFVSAVANESAQIFTSAHHVITSLRIPLVVHVLRFVFRHLLVFFHNFAAAVAAFLILGGHLTAASSFLLVSVPLLFIMMSSAALIVAVVGARFRDIAPVIGIVMQLTFFMTPIMWRTSDIPNASKWWVTINPWHHVIEVVRAPMLGTMPAPLSVEVLLFGTLVLVALAYVMFCSFRHRIAYWL